MSDRPSPSEADTLVGPERRRAPRVPSNLVVSWGTSAGHVRDLSEGGACVETPAAGPESGAGLLLELIGGGSTISVPVVVRWVVPVGKGTRFGVQFRLLTPELVALIRAA